VKEFRFGSDGGHITSQNFDLKTFKVSSELPLSTMSGLDQSMQSIFPWWPRILFSGALGLLESHNLTMSSYPPDMNVCSSVVDQRTDDIQPLCDVKVALTSDPSVDLGS